MSVRRNVLIDEKDDSYLELHPEINLSGLVRKAIKELREKEEGKA